MAFDQLEKMSVRNQFLSLRYLPMPEEVDACARYGSIIDARHWCALENTDKKVRNGPAD